MKGVWIVTTVRWIFDNVRALGVFILVGLGVYAKGRRAGAKREAERNEAQRAAEEAESHGERIKAMRRDKEISDEIAGMSDDDVARRLHERWRTPSDQ